jgi:IS66 C-terminal element
MLLPCHFKEYQKEQHWKRDLVCLLPVGSRQGGYSRRANGVEPFEYLSELFKRLPTATTVEAIEALLPWNLKTILDARKRDL